MGGQCDNWCRHIYTLGAAGPTKGDGVKVIVPKNTNVESLPGGYGACYDNYGQSYVPGTIIEDPTMCRTSTCTYLRGTQNTYIWSNEATCQLENRDKCWENCDSPTISGQCDNWCRHIYTLGAAGPTKDGSKPPRTTGDGVKVIVPK